MDDEMVLPVFPLPEVIFFPRTMLPLHVFELRYRDLVRDLLEKPENERLFIISKMNNNNLPMGQNPFEPIATVGKLVHVEHLEDGRSNIVVYGQFTAEVKEILPSPKSYRIAEIVKVREEYWKEPLSTHHEEKERLMKSIRDFMRRTSSKINNLEDVKLDDLVNGLAFSLNIESDEKQELLEKQQIDMRINYLIDIIDRIGYYSEFVPDKDEFDGIN